MNTEIDLSKLYDNMPKVPKVERFFTIAIDAGHDLSTPARRVIKSIDPNETQEWVLNDRVADRLEVILARYPQIITVRTDDTTGKTYTDLADRAEIANNANADLFVSIHHNAGINGGTGGGISAYSYYNSEAGAAWRDDIYAELIKLTGLKGNRSMPLASAGYAVLKWTKAPAVLFELGFMDSVTDAKEIITEKHAQDCATAIANVIIRRFGIEEPFDNNVAPVPAEPIRYNTIEELPEWAHEPISVLVNDGILAGVSSTELKLDITEAELRAFVLVGRVWMRLSGK